MTRVLSLLAFFVVVFFCKAFSQDNEENLILSLRECEELAFQHSRKIKDANLSLEISRAKQTQASHAKILPKFELRNIWGPSPKAEGTLDPSGGFVIPEDVITTIPEDLRYFTQVDLDIVQPIYTFGRLSGLANAAEFGVKADEANLRKNIDASKLEIRKLYWGLLLARELLAVVENTKKELSKAEDKIEELLDEGSDEVSQNDLFKLQIAKYEVNKRHRDALDKIELTKSALKTSLGISETIDIDLASERLEALEVTIDSLENYINHARNNRPEVAQLTAGINARHALIGVSKSDYYPQFFLGGQIKYNFAKDRFDPPGQFIYNPTNYFRPGLVVGLNWNLNFLQTRDKIRLARAEYNKLAHQEEALTEGIQLEVKKAYLELVQAGTNMRESRKALRASDNWLRSETMSWDIGVGDVKELIDAFKANGSMQVAHYENIFNYNVSLAILSKVIGMDLYPN